MKSLDEVTGLAASRCAIQKQSVDVYITDTGYRFKLTSSLNSETFERRLTYAHGRVTVKDNKGHIVRRTEKVQTQKTPKKEQKDAESN